MPIAELQLDNRPVNQQAFNKGGANGHEIAIFSADLTKVSLLGPKANSSRIDGFSPIVSSLDLMNIEPRIRKPEGTPFERHSVAQARYIERREASGAKVEAQILDLNKHQPQLRSIFREAYGHDVYEGELDVYNVTPPINFKGRRILGARVQPADGMTLDSIVILYELNGEDAVPLTDVVIPYAEDPTLNVIKNQEGQEEIVLGVVEVDPELKGKPNGISTVFRRASDIEGLQDGEFLRVVGMKDVRLAQREDGVVDIYGRPQKILEDENGEKTYYGKGQYTHTTAPSADEITPEAVLTAPTISMLFQEGDWGGSNQVRRLANGVNLIAAHRATEETDENGKTIARDYAPQLVLHNPLNGKTRDLGIAAIAEDVAAAIGLDSEKILPRADDLWNVIFTGGLDEEGNIWGGFRDRVAVVIKSPVVQRILHDIDNLSEELLERSAAIAA